jgi:hypothetical protein
MEDRTEGATETNMVKRHRVIVSTVMDMHRSAKRHFATEKHNQNDDHLPQQLPDSPVCYKIRQRHLTTVMYKRHSLSAAASVYVYAIHQECGAGCLPFFLSSYHNGLHVHVCTYIIDSRPITS